MITLHQFPAAFGVSSVSPFCTKVEGYLRLVGLEYRLAQGDPRRAPKGKLPYIEDDGAIVADSASIIEYLKQERGRDLDAWLDDGQRATGRAVRRMVEEGLYWSMLHARWIDDEGWATFRPVLASMLPAPVRGFLPAWLRRSMRKSLQAQGTGRHSAAEIYAIGVSDLDALADLLAERPFMLGEEPASVDATVHAFLWHVAAFPAQSPLTRVLDRRPNLAAYVERLGERMGWSEAPGSAAEEKSG